MIVKIFKSICLQNACLFFYGEKLLTELICFLNAFLPNSFCFDKRYSWKEANIKIIKIIANVIAICLFRTFQASSGAIISEQPISF